MSAHRLWAGCALVLSAVLIERLVGGSWSLALLVGIGILLVLGSYSAEREASR